MLASITPLGERGRGSRWALTVVAFASAATAAGAALGAMLGTVGWLALSNRVSDESRLAVLAAALAGAVALDAGFPRVPGPRRQVNERWLDEFRGWVYGAAYGSQLGVGVSTVVTSAATYVAIAAALLSATPVQGAVVMGSYGAIRGLTPLLSVGVRAPGALFAVHRTLERSREPVRRAGMTALLASLGVALAGVLA
jgi:sulfite exporter TauE/SafE